MAQGSPAVRAHRRGPIRARGIRLLGSRPIRCTHGPWASAGPEEWPEGAPHTLRGGPGGPEGRGGEPPSLARCTLRGRQLRQEVEGWALSQRHADWRARRWEVGPALLDQPGLLLPLALLLPLLLLQARVLLGLRGVDPKAIEDGVCDRVQERGFHRDAQLAGKARSTRLAAAGGCCGRTSELAECAPADETQAAVRLEGDRQDLHPVAPELGALAAQGG